jgi:site-specific DNA-adenine methylase
MHRTAFSYYGGKGMIIKRYPKPKYKTIIEPFAGGAAYSLRWWNHDCILYEINQNTFNMWDFIQNGNLEQLKKIPKKVNPGTKIDSLIFDSIHPGLEFILKSAANVGTAGNKKKY